jgi:hypothetical protein
LPPREGAPSFFLRDPSRLLIDSVISVINVISDSDFFSTLLSFIWEEAFTGAVNLGL